MIGLNQTESDNFFCNHRPIHYFLFCLEGLDSCGCYGVLWGEQHLGDGKRNPLNQPYFFSLAALR